MSSKRVVIYFDDLFDKEIVEFLANLPPRRISEKLREALKRGIELKKEQLQ